ncbi:MAG: head GIN domain-containing protein [Chitinophagaceae bacterium]
MKQLSLAVLSALAILFSSCEKVTGDGPVIIEERLTGNFNGLEVRMDADVQVKQEAAWKVEITAQRNILNVLETYVSNSRLVIKFKNNVRVKNYEQIKIAVSAPLFNSLKLSGSGSVYANGNFSPANMELAVSGSGDLRIQQLNTGVVDASVSGSGNIYVESGVVSQERLRISGSGNIDFPNVVAAEANTQTSGSGNIRLHATQKLDVTISGSGNVYYKGSPVINTNISGSGKVVHF